MGTAISGVGEVVCLGCGDSFIPSIVGAGKGSGGGAGQGRFRVIFGRRRRRGGRRFVFLAPGGLRETRALGAGPRRQTQREFLRQRLAEIGTGGAVEETVVVAFKAGVASGAVLRREAEAQRAIYRAGNGGEGDDAALTEARGHLSGGDEGVVVGACDVEFAAERVKTEKVKTAADGFAFFFAGGDADMARIFSAPQLVDGDAAREFRSP